MCKAIILISICIQVYDLCTDSIYPCYDDRWFSMIIDDGTPWWKYWFGVKQGLSRGWSGVDLGSIRGRVGVDQGSIWGQPGGHFTCFSWPPGVILWLFDFHIFIYEAMRNAFLPVVALWRNLYSQQNGIRHIAMGPDSFPYCGRPNGPAAIGPMLKKRGERTKKNVQKLA